MFRAILLRSPGSASRHCSPRSGSRAGTSWTKGPWRCSRGIAAHSMLPLDRMLTAGVGLTLGAMCHVAGWPIPRGGAQAITNALVAHLRALGGEVVTGTRIHSLDALPSAKIVLCDLSPRPFLEVAGHRCPPSYRRLLETLPVWSWRVQGGLGALGANPVERARSVVRRVRCIWAARSRKLPTRSERRGKGKTAARPFVLLSQPTVFDPTRAPSGKHVAWAYCHVPQRVDDEHAGGHRAADRALRARVSRMRAGAVSHDTGRP